MQPAHVYVTNAGDGTVSIVDEKATASQSTFETVGHPIGAVRTIDSHLWVADGVSGNVKMLAPDSGQVLQTIQVGPDLTGLSATPDGHYLALSSSDPDHALYTVDLLAMMLGQDDVAV